jgi:hypothetical protein
MTLLKQILWFIDTRWNKPFEEKSSDEMILALAKL